MYRQGLGDCFLLTFDPKGTKPIHMLIDCGTLGASSSVKIADVIKDIRTTTGDHLHVLIATHEHKDHLSGFNSGDDEFAKMKIDHVWLAWTEKAGDPDAEALKKYADDLGLTAGAASNAFAHISATLPPDPRKASQPDTGKVIRDLLGFFGDDDQVLGADFAKTINTAMNFVRGRVTTPRFLEPGQLVEETWLPGYRFFILGPPRSEASLKDLGDHDDDGLYHLTSGLRAGAASATSAGALTATDELEMPFDSRFRLRPGDPLAIAARRKYEAEDEIWRRIDLDWLESAGSLALQLDSLTNNTSLAFAIERISDGKVLIFPADSQLGNWKSWHDPKNTWSITDHRGTRQVTARDLLQQAVFYKVGHHGSHNATAKDLGLGLMTRAKDLIAFIPVDRAVALKKSPPNSWQMPAAKLYGELLEHCQGRVVRSDLGWADDANNAADKDVEKDLKNIANAAAWTTYKKEQAAVNDKTVKIKDLYIDFLLD